MWGERSAPTNVCVDDSITVQLWIIWGEMKVQNGWSVWELRYLIHRDIKHANLFP